MSKLRLLVVPGAIDPALNLSDEMTRLANIGNNSDNLSVEIVLPNRATRIDLVSAFRVDGKRCDILHLLGHSNGETFTLAGGDILTDEDIIGLCADSGAKVLYINACDSAAICQYAANTGVAVALGWAGSVVDENAIVAAVRFYSELSDFGDPWGGGLRKAYEATRERKRLLWLTNGEYTKQIVAPIVARLDGFDKERKEQFERFSSRLDTILDQSTASSAGLMSTLAAIKDQFYARIEDFSVSHTRLRWSMYAVIAIIAAAIALAVYAFAVSAQTIPDPTPTLLPGCGSSGSQPPKCQTATPTFAPTSPANTPEPPTSTPIPPTDTPAPPTDTPIPPTDTPTRKPTRKPEDTPTRFPTWTPTDTPEPPKPPTRQPIRLPTLTPTLPPC